MKKVVGILTLFVLAWGVFHFHTHAQHSGDLHPSHVPCQVCTFSREANRTFPHLPQNGQPSPDWFFQSSLDFQEVPILENYYKQNSARAPPLYKCVIPA